MAREHPDNEDTVRGPGSGGVGLPVNTELPVFVYGLLKPGELAHDHVVGTLVRQEEVSLSGAELRIRDGLPLLVRVDSQSSSVSGTLMWPLDVQATYERMGAFEPKNHYRWATSPIMTLDGEVDANLLLGKSPDRGTSDEPFYEWRASMDPSFSFAMRSIGEMIDEYAVPEFPCAPGDSEMLWDYFVRLSATYLVLWSVMERYTTLRFGPTKEPMQRLVALQFCEDFRTAAMPHVTTKGRAVIDSRKPKSSIRPGADAGKALEYWYQVRSNLSHRGKSAFRDGELLRTCTLGLYRTLSTLLDTISPR